MMELLAPFSLWLVLSLHALPGISSLHWNSDGLWLLADNVDGIYHWDVHKHTLTPHLPLIPQGDFAETPKAHKSDFEASAWIDEQLWIFGSGSAAGRHRLVQVDLQSKTLHTHSLQALYHQIEVQGWEVNIEGATAMDNGYLLANRGHLGQPENQLIRVQSEKIVGIQTLVLPTPIFAGLSSLEYERETDRLWFTATTELTGSVYEDGQIGDSYLGWIEAFSQTSAIPHLQPSFLVNLNEWDPRFAGHKIEGLALAPDQIYLGSDNDGLPPALFVLKRLDEQRL